MRSCWSSMVDRPNQPHGQLRTQPHSPRPRPSSQRSFSSRARSGFRLCSAPIACGILYAPFTCSCGVLTRMNAPDSELFQQAAFVHPQHHFALIDAATVARYPTPVAHMFVERLAFALGGSAVPPSSASVARVLSALTDYGRCLGACPPASLLALQSNSVARCAFRPASRMLREQFAHLAMHAPVLMVRTAPPATTTLAVDMCGDRRTWAGLWDGRFEVSVTCPPAAATPDMHLRPLRPADMPHIRTRLSAQCGRAPAEVVLSWPVLDVAGVPVPVSFSPGRESNGEIALTAKPYYRVPLHPCVE
jgi:hypothetical protein